MGRANHWSIIFYIVSTFSVVIWAQKSLADILIFFSTLTTLTSEAGNLNSKYFVSLRDIAQGTSVPVNHFETTTKADLSLDTNGQNFVVQFDRVFYSGAQLALRNELNQFGFRSLIKLHINY